MTNRGRAFISLGGESPHCRKLLFPRVPAPNSTNVRSHRFVSTIAMVEISNFGFELETFRDINKVEGIFRLLQLFRSRG